MKMKLVTTCALLGALAQSAFSLTFDGNTAAGVYYGSGNANGGWTIDNSNGIELGLRTHQRYPNPANTFNSGGDGTYSWNDQNGYNGAENRSSWNYDFSIDVSSTTLALSNFIFQLWIDSDAGAGQIWNVINPMLIPDNARPGVPYGPTDTSSAYAQNSENVRWPFVGIPGYDNTIAGTYDFALIAKDNTGDVLAKTYMRVNVNGGTASGSFNGQVPDSGTSVGLLGLALAGVLALRRKFQS